MKNLGFKLTLLIFFIAILSGFYMRLPLVDNLIRAFVIYLIFSVLYLAVVTILNQVSLESLNNINKKKPNKSEQDKINHATPNIAK